MSQVRDAVSMQLGSLLLKGYKMLADSCPTCNNVLMQDKKGVVICVNCNETRENVTNKMEIEQPKLDDKLEHGYIESSQYTAQHGSPPEVVSQIIAVLLEDIKAVGDSLKRNKIDISYETEKLSSRLFEIKYVRECAETIKSLQDIRT